MIRDHGEVDEGEVGAAAALDVSGEPPAAVKPAEGAFDDPALGEGDEAPGGIEPFHDLKRRAGGLANGGCGVRPW